ncbi:hypothetical protein N0V83_009213 [Neocucurbitaria cava]|uniref:Uncharacterized protein n=1 Tax=Neocucurbitaria cava TaxID=798079 RepID=A0A9W8Y137_9PLEO|nr:hypothetical protein N0V83_009213 [Neocucurbitaria cava]
MFHAWDLDIADHKGEMRYLREQMDLRQQSEEAGETTALLSDMLTNLTNKAILAITSGTADDLQRLQTNGHFNLPPGLIDAINKHADLREQLAMLKEVKQSVSEPFAEEAPLLQPGRSPTPVVEIHNSPSSQALPSRSAEPEDSVIGDMSDAEDTGKKEHMKPEKGQESVGSMSSVPNDMATSGPRRDSYSHVWPSWLSQLRKRQDRLREMETALYPDGFSPPIVYMARTSTTRERRKNKRRQNEKTSSATQQRLPLPENASESPAQASPAPELPTELPAQDSPAANSPSPAGNSPAQDSLALEEAPCPSGASDADVSGSSSDDKQEATSAADESSAARSDVVQMSASALQSSGTEGSSSISLARQNSALQTSAGESSGNPQTPIRSVVGSAFLSPNPNKTPHQSPASPNVIQGFGPPVSRLSYRLELEKSRSRDGVVPQARFAEEELLPGETQGESATSRVSEWLDGAGQAEGLTTDEQMRDAPDLSQASPPESQAVSRRESHTGRWPEPQTESHPETYAEAQLEPQTQSQPEQQPRVSEAARTHITSQSESQTESQQQSHSERRSEPHGGTQSQPQPQANVAVVSDVESQPELQPEPQPEDDVEMQSPPQSQPSEAAGSHLEPQPELQAEFQKLYIEGQPEPQPEPHAVPLPESRPESQQGALVETQPQGQTQQVGEATGSQDASIQARQGRQQEARGHRREKLSEDSGYKSREGDAANPFKA